MTDRELDELGSSLLAQDAQNKPRAGRPPEPPAPIADAPTTHEWTPEQLRRLDNLF